MISIQAAANELLDRRTARNALHDYIAYTRPEFKASAFSRSVCETIDAFVNDVYGGKRPVMVFQAPPQHGKSLIVSRCLPAYLLGRDPSLKIGAASYSDALAHSMAIDVRRALISPRHQVLFPTPTKTRYDVDRMGEFGVPGGTGGYVGMGIGSGLTGRAIDIGIIDDPTKNEQEALSQTVKQRHWDWYQSVFSTRLSERSGQIIMATSWAQDDLPARIVEAHKDTGRLTHLRFPALNIPGEVGYDDALPQGALVPGLKSEGFLRQVKSLLSSYWWSAMYQQRPMALGGNVFISGGIRYYDPAPKSITQVICSWDCTFKAAQDSDYVVGQAWGRSGAEYYLLDQVRGKMTFTESVQAIVDMYNVYNPMAVLIEDKANGPAILDVLRQHIPCLVPISPDGPKLARAHAITAIWEAGNILIPQDAPWVKGFLAEVQAFPASANDDQVDAMTQAIRWLSAHKPKVRIAANVLTLFGGGRV